MRYSPSIASHPLELFFIPTPPPSEGEKSIYHPPALNTVAPSSLALCPGLAMFITSILAGCAVSTILLTCHTHFSTITKSPLLTSLVLTCRLLYRLILSPKFLSLKRDIPRLASLPMTDPTL